MADDMGTLARMPPEIVRNNPRYQQQMFESWGIELWDGHQTTPDPPKPLPIWHLDGVDWVDHPIPRRLHRHWPQTVGHVYRGETHYRCACGAHGAPGQPWIHLGGSRRRRRPAR